MPKGTRNEKFVDRNEEKFTNRPESAESESH